MDALIAGLIDPHFVPGHLPYVLLVLSMLMRDIVWLRVLAIAAGVTRIVIRGFIVYDPVAVLWEAVLVAINLGQLLLLWWYANHHRFTDDEQYLLSRLAPGTDKRALRRLFRHGRWRQVEPEAHLTEEGRPVDELMFLADGVVRIEKHGEIVAVCGRGDFIGEMSFISGGDATATAIADRPIRLLSFSQAGLRNAAIEDAGIREILETAFNRNLIDKLRKSGAAMPASQ